METARAPSFGYDVLMAYGRPLRLVSALVSALLIAGCSGSSLQDVLAPAESSGGTSGSGGSSGSSGTATPTDDGGGTTSGSSGTPTTDAGTVDAGSGECLAETEPNDSQEQANFFTTSICGNVAANDIEWLSLQLQPASTEMKIDYKGKVRVTVFAPVGPPVVLGSGGKVTFVKGGKYFVKVEPENDSNKLAWRVELLEK